MSFGEKSVKEFGNADGLTEVGVKGVGVDDFDEVKNKK